MNDKPQDSAQPPTDAATLRQLAEAQVRNMASPALAAQTPEEIQQMLHELRVHQIELEMQNEELRTAQEQIEAGRARYFDLYDLAPVGYCTLSEQGLILEANLTAATLLNTARSALIKRPISRFILKEDQDNYYRHRKQLLATGATQQFELRLVKPDGAFFWVHLAEIAAQADDGAPVVRVAFSDIDERKLAEAKLLELKMAVEQSSDGIALADMDGHIVFVNQAWAAMHGYAAEELVGQHLSVFHTPEQMENEVTPFNGRLIATGSNAGEMGHCRKDGTTFIAEMAVTVVKDTTDTPFRLLAAAHDITEQKRTEAELAQHRDHLEEMVLTRTAELTDAKDAAESANRAKSAFLSNMSHELRTPMTAIMGMTDFALRRATDPKQAYFLTTAMSSAEHLLRIINGVLDISKIASGKLHLEEVDFQFEEILNKLVSMVGPTAAERRLTFLVQPEPGLPQWHFKGDPTRLGQILINLASNAIKFTDQGTITVRATRIEDRPGDALLRWEIADTGIGIDTEAQKRLFTAFEQADNSMTRQYGGTGLGLAFSKRLVAMMGGEIGVESTLGKGSTFWFTVRLNKAPSGATPSAPTPESPKAEDVLKSRYAHRRILLAEDEPLSRLVISKLLDQVGLVVDLAEDGRQALEMAPRNPYALILMDIQMPVMNGLDATRAIRGLPGHAHTPILAMTASAFDEDRQVCLDAGMNDHITKPVKPQRLYETLLAWLEKRAN